MKRIILLLIYFLITFILAEWVAANEIARSIRKGILRSIGKRRGLINQ